MRAGYERALVLRRNAGLCCLHSDDSRTRCFRTINLLIGSRWYRAKLYSIALADWFVSPGIELRLYLHGDRDRYERLKRIVTSAHKQELSKIEIAPFLELKPVTRSHATRLAEPVVADFAPMSDECVRARFG